MYRYIDIKIYRYTDIQICIDRWASLREAFRGIPNERPNALDHGTFVVQRSLPPDFRAGGQPWYSTHLGLKGAAISLLLAFYGQNNALIFALVLQLASWWV